MNTIYFIIMNTHHIYGYYLFDRYYFIDILLLDIFYAIIKTLRHLFDEANIAR